jgi:hypothetical protein
VVSHTPWNASANPLPRRDLIAIFAFLNRKREQLRPERDPFEQAEGILGQLAAAARMQ